MRDERFRATCAYRANFRNYRTLTLNVFRVNDESMRRFLLDKSLSLYFLDLILHTRAMCCQLAHYRDLPYDICDSDTSLSMMPLHALLLLSALVVWLLCDVILA